MSSEMASLRRSWLGIKERDDASPVASESHNSTESGCEVYIEVEGQLPSIEV